MNRKQILYNIQDKAVIIQYKMGSAGNLVQRIIGNDSKFYWDKILDNHINIQYVDYLLSTNKYERVDSLNWPEEGFNNSPYSACHSGDSFFFAPFDNSYNHSRVKKLLIRAIKVNKIFIFKSHEYLRPLNKNIIIIRIVGNTSKLNRKLLKSTDSYQVNKALLPIKELNTYNLNINNLVSKDYNTFLSEYKDLCTYLNIEIKIDKVKDFINIWRSKQNE